MTDDPATTITVDTAIACSEITTSTPDNAVLTITVKPSPESEITSLTKWIAQIKCTPKANPETLAILTEASQEFVDYAWNLFKNSNKTRLFQSRHAAKVRKTVMDADDSEEETIQRTSRELTARLHGEFLEALKNDPYVLGAMVDARLQKGGVSWSRWKPRGATLTIDTRRQD